MISKLIDDDGFTPLGTKIALIAIVVILFLNSYVEWGMWENDRIKWKNSIRKTK